MSDLLTLLPLKLRLMREAAGLTQSELSEKSGVGYKSISTFETGRVTPSIANTEKLAVACGLTFERFIAMKTGDFGEPAMRSPNSIWPANSIAAPNFARQRVEFFPAADISSSLGWEQR